MGLGLRPKYNDTVQGITNFSYTSFSAFRRAVAASAGINLNTMAGYAKEGRLFRPWSCINDPIVPLLNHSDCEGELTPEECRQVAPRLREIVSQWDDENCYKQVGLELADLMQWCADNNDPLLFC